MEKENSFGQIRVPMMATSSKITFTEKVNTCGPMVESTTVNGLITKWKEKVPSLGVMVDDM